MSRPFSLALALLCCILAATVLAACGGSDEELLPGENAQEILTNLNEVEQLAANGQCSEAEEAIDQVDQQVSDLPGSVSRRLRNNLQSGVDRLREVTAESCGAVSGDVPTETTTVIEEEPDTTTEDTTSEQPDSEGGDQLDGPGTGRGGRGGGSESGGDSPGGEPPAGGGGGNQGSGQDRGGSPGGGQGGGDQPTTPEPPTPTPTPPDSGGISPGDADQPTTDGNTP